MKAQNPMSRVQKGYRQLQEKHRSRMERVRKDLELHGSEILHSDEMKQAFRQTHHKRSTVGEHTMRVASTSVLLCYALRRLHIKVDLPSVVIGSLCHDLGILGRDEKYASDLECYREHPKDSVEAARKILGEIPKETEDIIERHMWPVGRGGIPNSVEGIVVTAADKYNSVKDFIMGSEVKHTGIKKLITGKRDK